ncbi:MAG: molybdenum cofactor biosynthesis protein MoaC [Anaerolineae bacterium SM23_ 63]|nr:MAG: molybdenum cofactor biosynthesis protein MoaC [Anaerolineae bacterium SM23_ 63]HEY47020.1 cyclic pyranopterin monophosphate synthase MoaC [Anaerolineae bacterium]
MRDMDTPHLTHVDKSGRARMIDVSGKPESERWAVARGSVVMNRETLEVVKAAELKKGDLRSVAEIAGVMGAKRTSELIPLCHPLPLTQIEVQVDLSEDLPGASITATVRTTAKTGVEMEALTAVSVAALTVYDMIKSVDRAARITDIRLVEKGGGTSGDVILER